MSIRLKILSVVLPLLVTSVVLVGGASYFLAVSSVTAVAFDFLSFKAEEVEQYAESQWKLLVENGKVGEPEMEAAAQAAVVSFARSVLRSDTEAICAFDREGNLAMVVGPLSFKPEEQRLLQDYGAQQKRGLVNFLAQDINRVAVTFPFVPFGWQVFVSEQESTFYGQARRIGQFSVYILVGALVVASALLLLFARFLTRPIRIVTDTMQSIIETNNLSERVPVLYRDEIGRLSYTFNVMLQELEQAYTQIKKYAFEAVVAQKRETKIRNIFQLYVPKDVIDEVFMNPEKMLVGDNRDVAILFSDIRSFTTISEKMAPDELVNSLNRYFSIMVDVIMGKNGVVDKYIGDAIMAVFGAPVKHGNDALDSVLAGLGMIDALSIFNAEQKKLGGPEFQIGVGINYGIVTVGNIGCEKKMNYTVIGDTVNLASRLEGLTKKYHQPILFSQSVYEQVKDQVLCRTVDKVAVKGKTIGVPIYTSRTRITEKETEGWYIHEQALGLYYERDFSGARGLFERVLSLIPEDPLAKEYIQRCGVYEKSPPPPEWDGVEVMTEK
ncbi:adenylate/guanylate cyclase domain-containing protein [Treponema sp. J25]|uniref:adenylate/guanylate cyclase domain-containing protein n=1 Tax=Treponema sp. J25 TaxID=2094121 RepID=UPI00105019C9|nr:adenylate/guanylate cyclase domain-containing protein [Treponema sp. J25]TCW60076.1 adenylate/guanylate cyclase domain-containing protein [Treponema sp. J25]